MANRHDIYLWEMSKHPVPQSMDEARDLAENLAEQAGTLSPTLFSVIEKTKAYIAQQDAQIQYAYRWFGKEQEAKGCLVLTLPDYGAELGLRFIVQTAMALDLVVYDHEMRMVFLPPDRVLPMEADEYWDALCENLDKPAFPTNDKDFADWFEPKLAQMLAKYGFVAREITTEEYIEYFDNLSNKYYVRQINNGEQHIFVGYSKGRYSNEYNPYVSLGILLPQVTHITNQFDFEKPYRGGGGYTYDANFSVRHNTILNKSITNHELAFEYINVLEKQMISLAERITTIQSLDGFFCQGRKNHPVNRMYEHSAFTPFTLVVASLANNPDFGQIAEELANLPLLVRLDADKQERYHSEYAKLLKYLRE